MTTYVDPTMTRPAMHRVVLGKAQVAWRAPDGAGCGGVSAKSGALTDPRHSLETRFGSGTGGTPEELLAAAHAGCFTTVLALALRISGYPPTELNTEATVTQESDGLGYRISCSALRLRAKVRNLTSETFETIAWEAVNNCPVSRVLRTQIRLDARVV